MVNYTLCPCCGSSEIVTAFKTSFFKTPALKCLECFFHFNKMTEQSFELLEKYYKNDYWISDFKKPTSKIRNFLKELKNDGFDVKYFIPQDMDLPIIGDISDVKEISIDELIEIGEQKELPKIFNVIFEKKIKN